MLILKGSEWAGITKDFPPMSQGGKLRGGMDPQTHPRVNKLLLLKGSVVNL